MWLFLKRVMGTTPDHEKAEERYEKAKAELREREKELDELFESVKVATHDHQETREALSKTKADLTETLRTVSDEMEAVTDEEIEEFKNDRPSSEGSPNSTAGTI